MIICDVEFKLPQGPVGVLCSGGADSSLVLYLLMKYSDQPIHILTLSNATKHFTNSLIINYVIDYCIKKTNNTNITLHNWFTIEQTNKELERLPLQMLTNKTFSTLYIGDTCYPPDELNQSWAEQTNDVFQNIQARQPNKNRPTKIGPMYTPYTNYDKRKIAEIYKAENIMDLFSYTRSCESIEDIGTRHCGNCWWCKEREWAFGRL